jgi:ankyrin repeat protein
MKKKVIVILLSISSHSLGMQLPFLSYSIPDLTQPVHKRCAPTELSPNVCVSSTILTHVKCNAVDDLRSYLKYKAERVRYCQELMVIGCMVTTETRVVTDGNGKVMLLPDVLQRVLHHRSNAPLLHEAVTCCRNHCVELLLEHKAHPNIATKNGDSPLHVARSSSMVQLLIDHGACIEQKNNDGETPFFKSIKNGCLDMAQILWAAGADVNACNKYNDTPLHRAAKYLDKEAIQFLLYRGAHINCVNKQGETAYQIICKRGGAVLKAFREWQSVIRTISFTLQSLSVMSLLDHNARQLKKILTCDVSDYCSPDIAVAEKLFKRCSDEVWDALKIMYSAEVLSLVKFVKDRSNDRKSFVDALRNDEFALAHQLLQQNSYLLHIYEGEHQKDEVNALFVDKVISADVSDCEYSYLQNMIHSGLFDVDACDELGAPVLSAVIQQSDGSNKYLDLLKAGAQVNAQDKYGNTPLFYAVMLENKDMISKLLLYGAVVNYSFGELFNLPDAMWNLMNDAYGKQKCCKCETHDHDLSSIPCVNRHVGHFICSNCYEKYSQKCPLCRRFMGSLLR